MELLDSPAALSFSHEVERQLHITDITALVTGYLNYHGEKMVQLSVVRGAVPEIM